MCAVIYVSFLWKGDGLCVCLFVGLCVCSCVCDSLSNLCAINSAVSG